MSFPRFLIGIDEVGRGPIAGPLCVGGCLVPVERAADFTRTVRGIKESKQLSFFERTEWLKKLTQAARDGECRFATAFINEAVIDTRGLSFALCRAVLLVLLRLEASPAVSTVLLDGGIRAPEIYLSQHTIIRGDETEPLIASASIVAKVRRDRYMVRLSKRLPSYGFESHKGYGTPGHYEALKRHGISPMHRMSFLTGFLEREHIALPDFR